GCACLGQRSPSAEHHSEETSFQRAWRTVRYFRGDESSSRSPAASGYTSQGVCQRAGKSLVSSQHNFFCIGKATRRRRRHARRATGKRKRGPRLPELFFRVWPGAQPNEMDRAKSQKTFLQCLPRARYLEGGLRNHFHS